MKKTAIIIILILLLFSCKDKSKIDENLSTTEEEYILGKTNDIKLKSVSFDKDFDKNTIEYYSSETSLSEKEVTIKEGKDPFVIIDHGPVEELPEEMKKPIIYVSFNYPIIPLAKLGEVMTSSSIMKIEPAIKGIYRFYGTRMIAFEPEEDVLPQREYTVTINKSVKSMGGKNLTGENKFKFRTEYLKILNYYPSGSDIQPEEAKNIRVTFSYPVNLKLIKSYLRIESNGKNFNYNIRLANKYEIGLEEMRKMTVICELKDKFSDNSEVKIILKKGARSEKDYIGIPEDQIYTFSTLKPFSYTYYSNYSYYEEKGDTNPVYIYFSHPIDEKSSINAITVSLSNIDIKNHLSIYNNCIKISNLPVTFNSKYNINISKNLKDIYGRNLTNDVKLEITVPDAASYYYFPNDGDKMLESQYPPRVAFEIQNIFQGTWKIGPIDNPYKRWKENELVPYDFSKYELNRKYIEVIDLKPYLNKDGKGFVGISWYFKKKSYDNTYYGYKTDLNLQVTDLGVSVRYGYNKMVLIVASLSTGKPIENAKVQLKSYGSIKKETTTDKNGFATFIFKDGEYKEIFRSPLNNDEYSNKPRIMVEYGSDKIEFVSNYSHNVYKHGVYNTESPEKIDRIKGETFMFTDRGLYKPGETVTFRGIDKNLKLGRYTPYQGEYKIEVSEQYSDSKPFYTESGKTTSSGGFFGSFKLPENIEPGYYYIEYSRKEYKASIYFQVAYFRRLAFQTSISIPDITYYKGDTINANLIATYLAGGALANAKYSYFWTKSSTYFKPKGSNWEDYRFGTYDYQSEETLSSGSGKLSGSGTATLKQDAKGSFVKGLTYKFQCYANVMDIDRQEIGTSKSIIVHPASFYLGLKFRSNKGYWSTFVNKGESVTVDYALVTPNGKEYKTQGNKIKVKLYREEWKLTQQKGVYGRVNTVYNKEEVLESEQIISASSTGSFSIKPEKVGEYFLQGETEDEKGRTVFTKFYFYSTGSEYARSWGSADSDSINLITDKNIYNPGEIAKIMVQTPIPDGKYILTIEREGIFEEKVIDIKGNTSLLEIQVKEEYVPVFYVALTSFSKRTEEPPKEYGKPDLGKPKGYFGIKTIYVSTDIKRIELTINPDKSNYRPGDMATYKIKATRDGKPLPDTEITFLAVDRGVLDLINYHVPDPLSFFYASYKFPLGVIGADSRSLLIDPVLYERKNLHGGDDGGKLEDRKDFTPTAVFEPFLKTDSNGEAIVKFKFPDNLTTYRCTALAVKDDFYGLKESEIRVNNPINVRMALPRRLRLRDTTFAGVIITNLSEKEEEVKVKIESDLLLIDGINEKVVKIKPNSTIEVPFKIGAIKDGEAKIIFTTTSSILNERLIDKIIVERPINKESFTTINSIKDELEKEEGLIIPSNILNNYGGVNFKLSSTRLNTLSSSIEYLYDYPYSCLEQRSSKLFPVLLFKDIITNFINIKNPKKLVEDELKIWADYQNPDGGFPFWLEGTRKSDIYISIKIAKFLYYAKQNGFNIPNKLKTDRLIDFIKNYDYEKYYEIYCKIYSYYVLSLFGENVVANAKATLDKEKDKVGISGYCMLGIAFLNNKQKDLANECFKKLKNLIKVGTQTIDLIHPYEEWYYFNSQVSDLALLLMFYQRISDDSDMITRITNTLMNRQKSGYWENTYTTEWVIESFYNLFSKEKGMETNFITKITIDGSEIFNTKFKGFSQNSVIKYFTFDNELKDFKRNTLLPLNIKKEGKGNLYYSITIRYSLPVEVIKARDEGFSILTEIFDMNNKPVKDNELRLGETYKMRVIVSTSKKRNFVALRCPIPSGCEIIDSSFVTSSIIKEKEDKDNGDNSNYYSEGDYYDDYEMYYEVGPVQKNYDNEVQYFFDEFYNSREEVEFIFRVTSPGIYPTPPVYVECMYEEEVFGRDNGKLWIVKQAK